MTHAEYQRQRRAALKAMGRCVICGRTAPSGYTTCPACRRKIAERQQQRRIDRIVRGLCPVCGKPVIGKRYTCPDCREKIRNYMKGSK